MTKEEYTKWANAMLELCPWMKAIAVNSEETAGWTDDRFFVTSYMNNDSGFLHRGNVGHLGKIKIDFDWRDSIVTRKDELELIIERFEDLDKQFPITSLPLAIKYRQIVSDLKAYATRRKE